MEMIIIFIILLILLFILFLVCLMACITYRKRKSAKHLSKQSKLLVQQSPSPLINSSQKRLTLLTSASRTSKDRICYTEVSNV
jgi:flagellar basal body-associated protein FliL